MKKTTIENVMAILWIAVQIVMIILVGKELIAFTRILFTAGMDEYEETICSGISMVIRLAMIGGISWIVSSAIECFMGMHSEKEEG